MKLTNKSTIYSIEHDVQVGELKATLVCQVWKHLDSMDTEFMDVTNISYMGVEINGYDNWRKFKKFHEEMGIDFGVILDKEFEAVFTEKAIKKLILTQDK